MNTLQKISVLLISIFLLVGCEDFLTPDKDNVYTEEEIERNPVLAEGLLLRAYSNVPGTNTFNEVATDDAVSNDNSNSYRRASNGEWKSTNNPFNVWSGSYTNIAYVNLFLSVVDKIEWAPRNEWQNENFKKRLKAEAYALRALYQFRLLQAHSGYDQYNNLLGFPIIDEAINIDSDWQAIARDSYDNCVEQILSDLKIAMEDLPDVYIDAEANDPEKTNKDAVYGSRFVNRVNRRVAQMLKARTLLHAASPAFNPTNNKKKWEAAANAAAEVIDVYGGLSKLNNTRVEYYLSENTSDILWRRDYTNSRNLETDNFPPSLYGNGRVNPTQNFVDEFPTIDGYPISLNPEGYDVMRPYLNRDPRLGKYVIYNGTTFKGTVINTINGARDGINMLAEASTRTGYYLKKAMNSNVNLTPGSMVNQRHFVTLMRYTEAFLIYAEAANEAWGPEGKGYHAYSAKEVMTEIRKSAGILPDNYISTLSTFDGMQRLIRSERRIELSFEGFRFWDIRRWNDIEKMKEPAKGTDNGGLSSIMVENRLYDNFMIYGPIPDSEFKKGLEQNKGW